MKILSKTLALATVAALVCASQAVAQTRPATPASANPPIQLTGQVPALCMLSRDNLLGASTVGAFVNDRMKQLGAVVQAELTSDQATIENDAKALNAQKPTLQADVFQQRGDAINQRIAAFKQKVDLRQRELEATQQKAFSRILTTAGPLVGQVVIQRGCGAVLDSNAVLIGNQSMDVTPAVITLLNGQLTQFAFDREHLDQQQAPGQ